MAEQGRDTPETGKGLQTKAALEPKIVRIRMKENAKAYSPTEQGSMVVEFMSEAFVFEEGALCGAPGIFVRRRVAKGEPKNPAWHPTFLPWSSIASVFVSE